MSDIASGGGSDESSAPPGVPDDEQIFVPEYPEAQNLEPVDEPPADELLIAARSADSPARGTTAALKVPPHSLDAEQSVLGGLMLDNDAWFNVAEVVQSRDFYRGQHQIIFDAMTDLAAEDQPLDAVTVSERLQAKAMLDKAGGLAYLAELTEATPGASNVVAYGRIVREHSTLRQLIGAANRIAESAFARDGRPSEELLDLAESEVFKISEGRIKGGGPENVVPLLDRAVKRIELLSASRNPITGIPTGFDDLDKKTAGLQKADLVIVAGRPSMGKTSFAMNMAEHAVMETDGAVLVFSMEMPSEQLVIRMLSSLGRIDQTRMRTGDMHEDDWPRFVSAVSQLKDKALYIDDTPALTPNDLRTRARRVARESGGLGMIVVDYLQLMRVAGTSENRTNEISEISRSLKAIAKEMECPLIALSQLNRGLESRTDKRPLMADLRECVVGETLVNLSDGRRVPIEKLVGETPEVLAMDCRQKIVKAKSEAVWYVGDRPVFDVRLASGRVITATARHRLFTGSGWQRLCSVQSGDRIALGRRLPSHPTAGDWNENRLGNPNVDTLPIEVFREVRNAMRSRGVSQRKMATLRGTSYGGSSHFSFAPSRQTADEYAELLHCDELRTWSESDLFWDRVVSIEPAGTQPVYDLTVPGPSSWLADGIVSHNSGAIEQDADLILFIYRDEVYNPESPDKGTAEIIIGKQRNGPIGSLRLSFIGNLTKFENLAPDRYQDFAPFE